MKNRPMYRQGDVLVRPVSAIPADAKPIKRVGGRVILAEGEVTGHHHAISEAGVGLLEHDGRRYLDVPNPSIAWLNKRVGETCRIGEKVLAA